MYMCVHTIYYFIILCIFYYFFLHLTCSNGIATFTRAHLVQELCKLHMKRQVQRGHIIVGRKEVFIIHSYAAKHENIWLHIGKYSKFTLLANVTTLRYSVNIPVVYQFLPCLCEHVHNDQIICSIDSWFQCRNVVQKRRTVIIILTIPTLRVKMSDDCDGHGKILSLPIQT